MNFNTITFDHHCMHMKTTCVVFNPIGQNPQVIKIYCILVDTRLLGGASEDIHRIPGHDHITMDYLGEER